MIGGRKLAKKREKAVDQSKDSILLAINNVFEKQITVFQLIRPGKTVIEYAEVIVCTLSPHHDTNT